MRLLLAFLFGSACALGQTGNACSSNTAANTGSAQSYAFCQPGVFDGRNKGGWIALNRSGDQSNTETQCYSPQNVFIQNGILTLVDRALTETCHYFPATNGVGSETNNFVSGFVQWNTFSFTFGDILIRAKGPSGISTSNAWPALWLLEADCIYSSKVTADNTAFNGQTCNWPNGGEIDIFEQQGGVLTSSRCNSFTGAGNSLNTYTISDSSAAFHIYELRWTAGSEQFFYDGALQSGCTVSGANVPSVPMFFQANIAMTSGGTSTGLPSSMQLDWVKVCQPSPCNGNGGNIVFYDDFVTPIAQTLVRPTARFARMSGSALPPSAVFTMGVAKNEEPKFK